MNISQIKTPTSSTLSNKHQINIKQASKNGYKTDIQLSKNRYRHNYKKNIKRYISITLKHKNRKSKKNKEKN